MKKLIKSKVFISVIAVFAMILTAFSGVILLINRNKNEEILAAETTIDSPMVVRKLWANETNGNSYTLQSDGGNVTLDDDRNDRSVVSQSSLKKELKNNEFVILNKRTNPESQKEVVLVSFNVENFKYETDTDGKTKLVAEAEQKGSSYYTLQVNAELNGKSLKTNETIKDQQTNASKYYFQLLNLNANAVDAEALYYSDGTRVSQDEIEGKYKFTFQFSQKDSSGVVGSQETTTMEFYVFNENTYKNTIIYDTEDSSKIDENNTLKLEPRISNTEKIDRLVMNSDQVGGTQYNYFNFNNENTTNYFGSNASSTDTLLFPTINYDITKYSLRYKVSLYGTYNIYEYIFAGYDDNGAPVANVYKDGAMLTSVSNTNAGVTTISVNDQTLNDFTIQNNIISIKLSNIGEYDFEFNYVYETKSYNKATNQIVSTGYVINSNDSNGYTDETISFVKKENWTMVGDCKLYIFGYQLYYSDYSSLSTSGNLEFTNKTNKFTDVTFKNDISEITADNQTNNFVQSNNLNITEICATNQAPITLSYYAKMTLENNKTKSYYKYWTSQESFENGDTATISNITNNTRFTKNGYYQVFIEYQFENYKYTSASADSTTALNNGNEINKYQFFSFAINNSEPTISVAESTGKENEADERIIATNGYTNQNVKIAWSASTEFDITPRVSILKKAYSTTSYTTIFDQEANMLGTGFGINYVSGKQITISKSGNINTNGDYQVVIHYGPGSHTLVKYRFTIDDNQIDGITTYSISNIDTDNTITSKQTSENIINTAFALDWNTKASGSEINVQYDFIALENGEIDNENLLTQLKTASGKTTTATIKAIIDAQYANSTLNIKNGYKLSSISSNIPYTKPEIESNKLTDINSMRTSAGFYLFTLSDSAGNISYKSIFVDNSKPVIYTFTNEETDFVLNENGKRKTASRDTIAIWGDNKAIAIENSAMTKLNNFLALSKETYSIANEYLQVKISRRTSIDSSDNIEQNYDRQSINSAYQIFEIKAPSQDAKWFQGEHIHDVSVIDQSEIIQSGNKQNNNIAMLELEMNSDNSLLMAYLTNGNTAGELNGSRLDNASVGNGKQLYLEWIQNGGNDFEVKSITYYYFPLTFDESSPIYPYSSTPEITNSLDLASSSKSALNTNKQISNAINLESETSLEGLYIVKREYKNPLSKEDGDNISGDYSPRFYSFFIDRNKVISYASNGALIGNSIGLNIGSTMVAGYQVIYKGENFLVDTNENNSKFITSKLPIKFINQINSLDKFDAQQNQNVKDNLNSVFSLNGENTGIRLSQQVINTFKLKDAEIFYKASVSDNFPTLPTTNENALKFKLNGYYKVILHDKTSKLDKETNIQSRSDNDFTFIFQIKVETPSANIVQFTSNSATGKNEFLYYAENEENISTNKTNMLVVWNKPASEKGFDAEIDKKNFSIVGTLENGKQFTLNVRSGLLSANGIRLSGNPSIEIKQTSEDSNFDNPTWDYYLDFNDIFSVLPSAYKTTSAKYEINLQYVGNEDDYSETFFKTTRTVVFDFKKPEHNYNRLLTSDIFLANYYTEQTYEEFVNNFNDYTSELNYENYAFNVTPLFTLDEMVVSSDNIWSSANMDTYRMFIRKYNKYSTESIENQQSIMPDDPRFSDVTSFPNRYRFNENYKINGKNIYTEISSYYWNNSEHNAYTLEYILDHIDIEKEYNTYYEIIEMDYAGNYRVYTIYLKDDLDSSMQASFTSRDELGANETTATKSFTYQASYTIGQSNKVNLINGSENLNNILKSNAWDKLFSCQLELNELFSTLISAEGEETKQFNEQYILVTVTNITNNIATTLTYKPNDSLDDFITQINLLVSDYDYDAGNIYYLTFTTSMGEYLKVEHRKPSKDYPSYTITSGPIGFDIEFNVSINDINLSSYFTTFEVYKAENGVLGTSPLDKDSNGKNIVIQIEDYLINNGQDNERYKYSFKMQGNSGSEYLMVFTDNFGRQLKIRQVIGVEDNLDKVVFNANDYELVSTSAYESTDLIHPIELIYTNNITTLKYQSILNTLFIYEMGINTTIDGKMILTAQDNILDEELITKSVNGIWSYPLITSATANNTIYKVVFTSTQGDEVYYIGYYNQISEISISSGGIETEVSNQQTYMFDKMIRLQVDDINPLFPTTITGIRQYLDLDGNAKTEQLGAITNDQTFSNLGNYTFIAKNNLGTTIVFFANIEEKSSGSFSVVYKIDGIEAGQLLPTAPDKANSETYGSLNNPYEYFTIYDFEVKTNEAGQYRSELTNITPITINSQTVGTVTLYKIYKQVADGLGMPVEKDVKYISISKIMTNTDFVRTNDNIFYINNQIQTGSQTRMSQDIDGNTKSATIKLEKTYNLVEGNDIILGYYYNGTFIKEINLADVTDEEELTFYDSGEYQFYFKDLAGNKQKFQNQDYFTMVLINDVVFTINSKQAVNNSVFNGSVSLTLQNLDEFKDRKITLKTLLNGKEINVSRNNRTYIFEDYGIYSLSFEGQVVKENGEVSNIVTNFAFRIINLNEAMATYEYNGLNNYEITKVVKYDTKDSEPQDITNLIKQELGVRHISTLALSTYENGLGGAGIYEITVKATYYTNKQDQEFTFKVWLNNDTDILIKCSIPLGSSTTKTITITLNKNQIYNKVGECKIMLNDSVLVEINESTAQENKAESFTIQQNGIFNVRLVTDSGNTLESFIITKNEPLNAVAIIVIVIAVIAVGAIVFIFIKLRKNMKVK